MGLVDDQQLPQAFVPYRPNPALRKGIRIRCSKRGMNDRDAFRLEDGIKRCGERGVIVVDQEVNGWLPGFQCPNHLSGLLSDPGRIRMRCATRNMDAPSTQLDKEQHVDRLQE